MESKRSQGRSGDLDTTVIWKKDWVEENVAVFQKAQCVILQMDSQIGAKEWQKSTASIEVWQQPLTRFFKAHPATILQEGTPHPPGSDA